MKTLTTKRKTPCAQHTPGPWFTAGQVKKPHNHALVGIGNGAVHVGYASITPALSLGEAEANVRLMTAAPELLALGEEYALAMEEHAQYDGFTSAQQASYRRRAKDARDIIAKAKGGAL